MKKITTAPEGTPERGSRPVFETEAEAIAYIMSEDYEMSFSQLKAFRESPRHLIRYLMRKIKVGEDAKLSGLFHFYLLEGEGKFLEKYLVMDESVIINSRNEKTFIDHCVNAEEIDFEAAYRASYVANGSETKITTEAKKKYGKFEKWISIRRQARDEGRGVVGLYNFNLIQELSNTFSRDAQMMKFLKEATNIEAHVRGKIEDIPFQGYIDIIGQDYNCDLKTLATAATRPVMRRVFQDGLHIQGAIYDHLCPRDKYYLLILDKKGNGNILELTRETITYGMEKIKELLVWFEWCRNGNFWNMSYNFYAEDEPGIFQVMPPWWAYNAD